MLGMILSDMISHLRQRLLCAAELKLLVRVHQLVEMIRTQPGKNT